mgnify:CR=1 FL=1
MNCGSSSRPVARSDPADARVMRPSLIERNLRIVNGRRSPAEALLAEQHGTAVLQRGSPLR